jgi:hypothetical protein
VQNARPYPLSGGGIRVHRDRDHDDRYSVNSPGCLA